MTELGSQLPQHAYIIRRLETLGEDERLAADLVERVFELGNAVGRVDVDEDEPGFGCGELGEHPLAVVGRPDADTVTGLQAERQKPGREFVDLLAQLAIAELDLLMADDERRA